MRQILIGNRIDKDGQGTFGKELLSRNCCQGVAMIVWIRNSAILDGKI